MYKLTRQKCVLLSTILLLCVGCFGNNTDLRGKVTYSDDGSPVPTGTVIFEKEGYMSRASISPDGTYIVGSMSKKEGIPPGLYQISVINVVEKIGETSAKMPITRPLIDQKYITKATSGLTIEVGKSSQSLDLSLDRYQDKKKK